MFSTYRVDKRIAEAPEQLGSKSKFWYVDNRRRMLFKAEERGTGEDWAEKIACQLCELLGLGHVHYELAELFDHGMLVQPGVICESCAPPPTSLVLGNQLLLALDPSYPANEVKKYKVREHTVQAVAEAIGLLGPPAGPWMAAAPIGIATALDVFVGYIMLDAWIANQDRHHENWGALADAGTLRLAPTFDHGAALARNISDDERQERLAARNSNRTVELFANRARTAFYRAPTDKRSLGTMECFGAFAELAPEAVQIWLRRLAAIQEMPLRAILAEVPDNRMSSIAKDFTLELLGVNQRRLLSERIQK